jgi:hypothetical protein
MVQIRELLLTWPACATAGICDERHRCGHAELRQLLKLEFGKIIKPVVTAAGCEAAQQICRLFRKQQNPNSFVNSNRCGQHVFCRHH